jgi:hypothetical protein
LAVIARAVGFVLGAWATATGWVGRWVACARSSVRAQVIHRTALQQDRTALQQD